MPKNKHLQHLGFDNHNKHRYLPVLELCFFCRLQALGVYVYTVFVAYGTVVCKDSIRVLVLDVLSSTKGHTGMKKLAVFPIRPPES